MRRKHDIPENELRRVIDELEEVRDEVQVNIALSWYKVCKASNEDNLQLVIRVLGRAFKHRSVYTTNNGFVGKNWHESQEVYIRAESKEGEPPIKKDETIRPEKVIRTGNKDYKFERRKVIVRLIGFGDRCDSDRWWGLGPVVHTPHPKNAHLRRI